jgi:hypothetical protein
MDESIPDVLPMQNGVVDAAAAVAEPSASISSPPPLTTVAAQERN